MRYTSFEGENNYLKQPQRFFTNMTKGVQYNLPEWYLPDSGNDKKKQKQTNAIQKLVFIGLVVSVSVAHQSTVWKISSGSSTI